jgi:hypothetical protein
MNLAAFWNFCLVLVGLIIIVVLIFAAMDFRTLPDPFKRFARMAVGGAAVLVLMAAVGNMLGASTGVAIHVTPGGILEFAIGVLLLYAFLWIVDWAIDFFQVPYGDGIKFVLSIIALVIILGLAEVALIGGGLGIINLGGSVQQQRIGR